MWSEAVRRQSLDTVGRALAEFYSYSAYGGNGILVVLPFKKAATRALESFLARDFYGWALCRNQDIQAAREAGGRRYKKINKQVDRARFTTFIIAADACR